MASASITFGVTGVTATVNGLGVVGYYSSLDRIELDMTAGGSGGTSGTSVACLTLNLYSSLCPGGTGVGFGPGALAPITLTVHDGDYVTLHVLVETHANVNAFPSNTAADAGIIVDPLYLTLPTGVRFDSGIAGFLIHLHLVFRNFIPGHIISARYATDVEVVQASGGTNQ